MAHKRTLVCGSQNRKSKSVKWKHDEGDEFKAADFVVAMDFGTTFSGVAYARTSDLLSEKSDAVHYLTNWPGQCEAGAREYCKTQTSLWYVQVPGVPASFELKGWGWQGFVARTKLLQQLNMDNISTPVSVSTSPSTDRQKKNAADRKGHFVTKFKLDLAGEKHVPAGLSAKRVVSDYLRELSNATMDELRKSYGRVNVRMNCIQFILTVPAIWDERTRQTMLECAQMAGLVEGPFCTDLAGASDHDVIFVSEPEAAAVYVHKTVGTNFLSKGAKFLVVDVGGGTTDIIVHEKVGMTTRANIKVKEVAAAKGGLVGGSYVDEEFFSFLRETIECFPEFEDEHPLQVLEITRWWEHLKGSFGGASAEDQSGDQCVLLSLPTVLGKAWKAFHKRTAQKLRDHYHSLSISGSTMEGIFDEVVEKIIVLMKQQARAVGTLDAILVVGGFSESPYLRMKIQKAFGKKVQNIIFPPNAGSAVVQGAVAFGVAREWKDMLMSRICPRTFGYDTSVPFVHGQHRKDYMVRDGRTTKQMCDNIFGVIMRKGQVVPPKFVHKITLKPFYREGIDSLHFKDDQDSGLIEINIYESKKSTIPLYVTEKGVEKIGTCRIPVPAKDQRRKEPVIEITVHFGQQLQVFAKVKHSNGERVAMPPVKINWTLSPKGEPSTVGQEKKKG